LERRALIKHQRLLAAIALLMLLAAVGLYIASLEPAGHKIVLSVDSIRNMRTVSGTYRSINKWKTIEKTRFEGVPVRSLLEWSGAGSASSVRIIASDGYFWPPVGEKLKIDGFARKSPEGLLPIIAFKMKGKSLDPEPDGTGPVRYVAPQYSKNETNKPSWVSNVRVIEVSPMPDDVKSPDPAKVPENEVWLVGDVGAALPGAGIAACVLGGLGVALLLAVLVSFLFRRRGQGKGAAPVAVLVLLALAGALLSPLGLPGRACAGSKVFSLDQLKAMQSFSGHYTFLKQLEPYTYYEADYKGVALATLLEQAMRLEAGASKIVVRSTDGYEVALSLEEARATYPNNLKAIIAYEKDGKPLQGGSDGEGPLRLIVPQNQPGKKDAGGDPNTPRCARMVYSMEVAPVPAGTRAPSKSSVSEGSFAVYGAVAEPPAAPAPTPEPQRPAEQPSQQQAAPGAEPQAQGQATRQLDPAVSAVYGAFGGDGKFQKFWGGVVFTTFLPRTVRHNLLFLFTGASK
jgi:DMSO/TMAO reductase YedYZ molybdopterin-dependent catalytic subunit